MRHRLATIAVTAALVATPITAHAATTQQCQYDVTGTTVTVIASEVGNTIWVRRIHHRMWHDLGLTTGRVTNVQLTAPANQGLLRVTVGATVCETT